jgi:sugar phosphate isomerase/epimerase
VNCRSGGNPELNVKNATDGAGRLCDYARDTKVKVVIEPHGGHSQNPDWLLKAMPAMDRPDPGILPDYQ